ncbi:MAG TPA: alkaline phosphatase family protein [Candidatus Dormibacteraeota bacterium]|nr:alkaline phosphatase family protein [Candidatus Dormibacteraeota bacterium]
MIPCKKVAVVSLFVLLSLALLTGCQGLGASSAPTPTPTPMPSPTPAGSLQSVNHIIFMMQENRSFDAYFGKINDYRASLGLGRDADDLETDFTNPTDSPDTQQIRTFHLATSCIFNTTAAWLESHGDANRFNLAENAPLLLDGFVHTAAGLAIFDGDPDTKGVRSMGFYTQADLPSPYWFATQFATSDRWYTPAPVQTEDARLYAMAATSQGLVHPPQDTNTQLTAKTIFQLLDAANISWKIYSVDRQPDGNLISTLRNFQPYGATKLDHIVPISQFLTDVQNGTLPQFSYIEPGFASGRDEHPGKSDNLQVGARFMNSLFTALINSVSWKDSIFIETFDEGGGLFDHVSPMIDGRPIQELAANGTGQAVGAGKYPTDAAIMHVPSPDGIKPRDLQPNDPPDDFVRTGFRVPLIIVSPFTKPHYVSHTPMDYTAVLKFVEKRFNLPTLTARDAAQADMEEFFDFSSPNLNPGTPASQPLSLPCDATLASGTQGVPFPQ